MSNNEKRSIWTGFPAMENVVIEPLIAVLGSNIPYVTSTVTKLIRY